MHNIYDDLPTKLPQELVNVLADSATVRIERIVSTGQMSPPGFWYDQDEQEFVLLVRGAARLRFADDTEVTLEEGSYLHIPAHARHRVQWTSDTEPTVWLAIFYH